MQKGIGFILSEYLALGSGMYLPHANIIGAIYDELNVLVANNRSIAQYVPNMMEVDLFLLRHKSIFIIAVSTEKGAHVPIRGSDIDYLKDDPHAEINLLSNDIDAHDVSETGLAKGLFREFNFASGFAIVGRYPDGREAENVAQQDKTAKIAASIIMSWAEKRKKTMENSKIFLSHKGINKPLIEKIDQALRMIGLKTWFDKDDLPAGRTLVRSIDAAFPECAAAVLFITGAYVDAGVIAREIDRADRESVSRADGFPIIPLVLHQHGGDDSKVPESLRHLTWKTVDDIDIVPAILRALPPAVLSQIKYVAAK